MVATNHGIIAVSGNQTWKTKLWKTESYHPLRFLKFPVHFLGFSSFPCGPMWFCIGKIDRLPASPAPHISGVPPHRRHTRWPGGQGSCTNSWETENNLVECNIMYPWCIHVLWCFMFGLTIFGFLGFICLYFMSVGVIFWNTHGIQKALVFDLLIFLRFAEDLGGEMGREGGEKRLPCLVTESEVTLLWTTREAKARSWQPCAMKSETLGHKKSVGEAQTQTSTHGEAKGNDGRWGRKKKCGLRTCHLEAYKNTSMAKPRLISFKKNT